MASVRLAKATQAAATMAGPQVAINKTSRSAYRRDAADGEWVPLDYAGAPALAETTSIGHARIGQNWYTVYPLKAG